MLLYVINLSISQNETLLVFVFVKKVGRSHRRGLGVEPQDAVAAGRSEPRTEPYSQLQLLDLCGSGALRRAREHSPIVHHHHLPGNTH